MCAECLLVTSMLLILLVKIDVDLYWHPRRAAVQCAIRCVWGWSRFGPAAGADARTRAE